MSFRVTQEEYQRLCDSCSATGMRSVSDLARMAIHWISAATTDPGIADLVCACETLERFARQLQIHLEHHPHAPHNRSAALVGR